MHTCEYNTFIEEDLTQWISVVIEHNKVAVIVTGKNSWYYYIAFVFKIIFQMLEAKFHGILARKTNFISEVGSSFIN